jgi:hypothetical protein
MYGPLIFLAIISAVIGITAWQLSKHKKDAKKDPKSNDKRENPPSPHTNQNYIKPQEFEIGFLKQNKFKSMGNCNPDVLYPINGLGPDYGWKMPENCPCTQFVQPP